MRGKSIKSRTTASPPLTTSEKYHRLKVPLHEMIHTKVNCFTDLFCILNMLCICSLHLRKFLKGKFQQNFFKKKPSLWFFPQIGTETIFFCLIKCCLDDINHKYKNKSPLQKMFLSNNRCKNLFISIWKTPQVGTSKFIYNWVAINWIYASLKIEAA